MFGAWLDLQQPELFAYPMCDRLEALSGDLRRVMSLLLTMDPQVSHSANKSDVNVTINALASMRGAGGR